MHVLEEDESGLLGPVLAELGRRGIMQVMVEGGAAIHAAFLKQGTYP